MKFRHRPLTGLTNSAQMSIFDSARRFVGACPPIVSANSASWRPPRLPSILWGCTSQQVHCLRFCTDIPENLILLLRRISTDENPSRRPAWLYAETMVDYRLQERQSFDGPVCDIKALAKTVPELVQHYLPMNIHMRPCLRCLFSETKLKHLPVLPFLSFNCP
jgi:hypothetical protein